MGVLEVTWYVLFFGGLACALAGNIQIIWSWEAE